MKSASPGLIALLATNEFIMADLYTFTLIGGSVVRLTTADIDIVSGGYTFSSQGPLIQRSTVKWQRGLQVDTLEIECYPKVTDLVNGQPFLSAIRTGAFDGAEFQLERAFMPTWGNTSLGTVIMFNGRIAEIAGGRSAIKISVNSHLELLSQQMPRNLYTPGCSHTVYDTGCTLAKASFTTTGTASAGATASQVPISVVKADGYYSLGTILFTSGANAGLTRTIIAHASNSVSLMVPLPNVPASGDGIAVTAGCNKAQATCSGKFGNLANYRGFPYIPVAETAQ